MKSLAIIFLMCIMIATPVYSQENKLTDIMNGVSKELSYDIIDDECKNWIEKMPYSRISTGKEKIWAYSLPEDLFYKFIENPSYEFLYNAFFLYEDGVRVYEYMEDGEFYETLLNGEKFISYFEKESLSSRDLFLMINYNFLEFCSEANLQKILGENGIYASIIERVIICAPYNEDILWISTENGYYFITFNYRNRNEVDYNCQVYSYEDFKSRFEPKYGKLKIDNEIIPNNEAVIFQDENVYVQLRVVFEDIFGKIEWDEEMRAVVFNWNGHKYTFKIDASKYEIWFKDDINVTGTEPWNQMEYFYKIMNGRIYIMRGGCLKEFLNYFNRDIIVNYETKEVEISYNS